MDYLELLMAVSGCQLDHETVRGNHYTGKLDYLELLMAVSGCQSDHDTVRGDHCWWLSLDVNCWWLSLDVSQIMTQSGEITILEQWIIWNC